MANIPIRPKSKLKMQHFSVLSINFRINFNQKSIILLDRIIYFPYWKNKTKFELNYILQKIFYNYGRQSRFKSQNFPTKYCHDQRNSDFTRKSLPNKIFSHTEQYFLKRNNIFCCSKIEKIFFLGVVLLYYSPDEGHKKKNEKWKMETHSIINFRPKLREFFWFPLNRNFGWDFVWFL
jgi:hypothetical protein